MADKQKASAYIAGGFSAAIIAAVINWEGNKPEAYPDPGVGWKLPTICVGHTGPDVKKGNKATIFECQKYLADDMKSAGIDVARCVTAQITREQFDALVSFQFNTGKLCSSTLVKRLNTGDCWGAGFEFSRWVMADGKVMAGLVRRRTEERKMFESGCNAR
jgi:lysozyme